MAVAREVKEESGVNVDLASVRCSLCHFVSLC